MKNRILLLIVCCAMVVSCSKDGDNGGGGDKDNTYGDITKLDIVGAEYLYITGSSGTQARSEEWGGSEETGSGGANTQLYKVMPTGQTEEVYIIDDNGERIPMHAMMISDMTDDLIFFAYVNQSHNRAYFARKSDGAVFEIPDMFHYSFGWGGMYNTPESYFFTDKYQNIYSTTHSTSEVYRIESKTGVTATPIITNLNTDHRCYNHTPYYNSHDFFITDYLGNTIYLTDYDDIRCVTSSGNSFYVDKLTEEFQFCPNYLTPFPKSEDGGFVYLNTKWEEKYDPETGLDYRHIIYKYTKDANNEAFEITPIFEASVSTYRLITLSDKIIAIDEDRENGKKLIVFHSFTDIKEYEVSDINFDDSQFTDNYLYWQDGTSISAMNLNTGDKNALHQLSQSRTHRSFQFADDMILFHSIDRQTEMTYLCEIKNGVYTETEVGKFNNNSAPSVINFIRVN